MSSTGSDSVAAGSAGSKQRAKRSPPAAVLRSPTSKGDPSAMTSEMLFKDLPPEGPLWSTRLWVAFSDLHVEERTLVTCLKVGDLAHCVGHTSALTENRKKEAFVHINSRNA